MTVAAPTPPQRSAEPPTEPEPAGQAVRVAPASAWWVLIAGAAGLVSALDLTIEKFKLLANPNYIPTCSINPILSCGTVMAKPQADVFGFPNPLIGIVAYSVVVVTGVLAVAKVSLPRWYWVGMATGTLLGVGFIHWLIFQSLYRIGALCPYCMVVWTVTVPLLVVVSSIALQPQHGNVVTRVVHQFRWSITALWFTVLILLILMRFWDYWSTLV